MKSKEEDLSFAKDMRLHVYLSRCGIASRRACERIILSGRVSVNGKVVTTLGFKIGKKDKITLDGREVKPVGELVYIALHKPEGYLCANSDKYGRKLAKDLFRKEIPQRLFHVGRLDYLSSGLIFFTNDGNFSKVVTHPRYCIEKEYLVTAKNMISDQVLDEYVTGVRIKGVCYRARCCGRLSAKKVRLTLAQGKNREIRKVLGTFGVTIKTLQRIRIGNVSLGRLKSGSYRRLTADEVKWFYSYSLDHGETL
jgi:23S rRNA pseudouridine2605 synthase